MLVSNVAEAVWGWMILNTIILNRKENGADALIFHEGINAEQPIGFVFIVVGAWMVVRSLSAHRAS